MEVTYQNDSEMKYGALEVEMFAVLTFVEKIEHIWVASRSS